MRRRDALALFVLVGAVAAGCSRLSFVKPDTERGGYTQVAPDYDVRSTPAEKRRMELLDAIGMAGIALQRGDLDSAEARARSALKIDPKSVDAYTVLAVAAGQRGQAEAAGTYYAKALQLAPQRGDVLSNYGAWLCSHGRAVESLAQFDAALRDPAYATPAAALGNAGACALRAGQTAKADENLRRALQIDPNNVAALGATAQLRFDQGQYLDARAFMQRRLVAAPADRDTLLLAVQIEERMGDAAAAARYRGLIQGNPSPQASGGADGANGR